MIPSILLSCQPEALLRFFPADAPRRDTFVGPMFLLVTAGQATLEIDGRPYTLQAGTLLSLLPYHLLRTLCTTADFGCLTLAFTFDFMADFPYMLRPLLAEKLDYTPLISLTAEECHLLESAYQSIAHHYPCTEHPSYRQILRSLLFVFTAEVSAIYSGRPVQPSATHAAAITGSFFRLLHEHFRTNRDARFYADRLCISVKHLSRIVARETGHAPSFWMADFTVREAMTLLKSTTLTITQLSEELNFANSSFFARYFKRQAGVSPQQYRSNPER